MINKTKEDVQKLYCEWCPSECQSLTKKEKMGCLASGGFADDLESLDYVQKAKDQSLPENPYNRNQQYNWFEVYELAQQDMFTPDKNGCVWVKVKKE